VVRAVSLGGAVSTFAGTGVTTPRTDGPAAIATFNVPTGIAVDAAGFVYVSEQFNHDVRKISPVGVVTTLAGTGAQGAADGPATVATFYRPTGIGVNQSGHVYVADRFNHLVRVITPGGQVSTLAGTGALGGADGPLATATFNNPSGVAQDAAGRVFVVDTSNNRVRAIWGGLVTTFAGSGSPALVDGLGAAASFNGPTTAQLDPAGNLLVADWGNGAVRRVAPSGQVSTVATGAGGVVGVTTAPSGLVFYVVTSGNLYVVGGTGCQPCGGGLYSAVAGSTSRGTCTACGTGSYGISAGSSVCTVCAAGAYSNVVGAVTSRVCTVCATGTFSTTLGVGACWGCFAGTYFLGGVNTTGYTTTLA